MDSRLLSAAHATGRSPLVVVGRGHSGSRLLAEALHRQGMFLGGALNRMFDSLTWLPLVRDVVLGLYPAYDRLLEPGDAWHAKVEQTAERFLAEGYAAGPWGWKLGVTGFILPLLDRVFPRLRVIHLIRDGRDVMLSRLRVPLSPFDKKIVLGDAAASSWWGIPLQADAVERYRDAFEMHSWVQFVRTARQYGRALGPDRYLELRYEEMCSDPVRTICQAFGFAGLEMSPVVREFVAATARTDRIGKWKTLPPERIAGTISIGQSLLEELGYAARPHTDPRVVLSVKKPRRVITMRIPFVGRVRWRLRRLVDPATRPLGTQGYLVLGMHRSGTSCLTGLLQTSGLWLGDVPRHSKHNEKGNLEDRLVKRVNHDVLAALGGSWMDPPRRIPAGRIDPRPVRAALEPYRGRENWVLKDPRLVLTLGVWLSHLTRCQLIGTFRHPLSVALSLQARDHMPVEQGIQLWTHYNRCLVGWHKRFRFPLVCFDHAGKAYRQQFQALCEHIAIPFDARAAEEFYEQQLVSHEHAGRGGLPADAAETYDYLVAHQLKPATASSDAAVLRRVA